jgi:hypothetical protein
MLYPLKRGENDEISSPLIEALKYIHTAKEAHTAQGRGEILKSLYSWRGSCMYMHC